MANNRIHNQEFGVLPPKAQCSVRIGVCVLSKVLSEIGKIAVLFIERFFPSLDNSRRPLESRCRGNTHSLPLRACESPCHRRSETKGLLPSQAAFSPRLSCDKQRSCGACRENLVRLVLACSQIRLYNARMADRDASQEALEQVQKVTESEPVNGEELLGSDDLKRQLREAKEAESKEQRKHEPPSP